MTTPPPGPRDDDHTRNAKLALRAQVKARLGAMSFAERQSESAAIVASLLTNPALVTGGPVLLYCPMPFEPDVSPLAIALLARGNTICAPLVDWPNWSMQAAIVRRWPDDLVLDAKGLRTPPPTAEIIPPESLAAVIVPGVAFDAHGNRLGRGGGFYDRYLAGIPLDRRLGVCFSTQLVEHVPTAPHDARVSIVISP